MLHIPVVLAFTAGVASFLAPCVLPLVPGYLAYLAGSTLLETKNKRIAVFINSIFFVLGFSLVFAIFGVLINSILGAVGYMVQNWLSRIAGAVIIVFGLSVAGLIELPWLSREYKFHFAPGLLPRHLTSFVFGAAFAIGWTPCVGAVLGSILALAAANPGSAFVLLLAYSLGMGVPFLFVGLFASEASIFFTRYTRLFSLANTAFGFILIALGVLVFTQSLNLLANFDYVNRWLLR